MNLSENTAHNVHRFTVSRRVSLVQQELRTLPEQMSSLLLVMRLVLINL